MAHHHHDASKAADAGDAGERRLWLAVAVNLLLTVAQIVGGVLAGSLALVADALHNFSDAGSLILALVARRIGRRPPDAQRTYGYGRAEVVGALINLTVIMVVAVYLLGEAVARFFERPPVDGWIVVIVAGIALVVDIATAALTYTMSNESVNIKAAFLHNVADALASVGVIVAGTLIILFQWWWTDLVATVAISIYIVWMSIPPMRKSIAILMQTVPAGMSVAEARAAIESVEGVIEAHHIHLWPIDERRASVEAHVVVAADQLDAMQRIKDAVREQLRERIGVEHCTLELETAGECGSPQAESRPQR
jgi:cobalt-zinc-cadmium efflux system protein